MQTSDTTVVRKSFTNAFVLDQPKLSRIMDILEQRYKENEREFSPQIEVTFANKLKITIPSLEKLFSLDNTVKNQITSLSIKDVGQPERLAVNLLYTAKEKNNIELVVVSGSNKYAGQVFAEVEEQIERTFSRGWLYKINGTQMIYIVMFLIMIGGFLLLMSSTKNSPAVAQGSGYMLSLNEINDFNSRAKGIVNREDKIDWLFDLQQRQLEKSLTKQESEVIQFGNLFTVKRVFVGLPILIALISFFYLFANYYPNAVFLWGDMEEHHAKLMTTRRTIWTVVIVSLFIGIASNLFSLGIASSIQ